MATRASKDVSDVNVNKNKSVGAQWYNTYRIPSVIPSCRD